MKKEEDKKIELREKLDEFGIQYHPRHGVEKLQELLNKSDVTTDEPEAPPALEKGEQEIEENEQEIKVEDPEVIRPKELPLVVKGKWKNEEQKEYAKVLNGYAYKNPKKWKIKKDKLIAKLRDLGDNPEKIIKYRGNKSNIKYSDKVAPNKLGE